MMGEIIRVIGGVGRGDLGGVVTVGGERVEETRGGDTVDEIGEVGDFVDGHFLDSSAAALPSDVGTKYTHKTHTDEIGRAHV